MKKIKPYKSQFKEARGTEIDLSKILYTYDKKDRTFTLEVSDIEHSFGGLANTVTLINPATKNKVTFYFKNEQRSRDIDNELQAWYYESVPDELVPFPMKLIVFND